MHYDVYSDEYKVSMYHWKQLPQFAGLTENEILAIIEQIHRQTVRQDDIEREAKMKKERADDVAYIEGGEDKNVLPEGNVRIDQGIIITPDVIDDHGFASRQDLSYQKGVMKMSLDEKKKIYV